MPSLIIFFTSWWSCNLRVEIFQWRLPWHYSTQGCTPVAHNRYKKICACVRISFATDIFCSKATKDSYHLFTAVVSAFHVFLCTALFSALYAPSAHLRLPPVARSQLTKDCLKCPFNQSVFTVLLFALCTLLFCILLMIPAKVYWYFPESEHSLVVRSSMSVVLFLVLNVSFSSLSA